ncbi:hypothetical protein L9F63_010743, partial [Diploptera punctata]
IDFVNVDVFDCKIKTKMTRTRLGYIEDLQPGISLFERQYSEKQLTKLGTSAVYANKLVTDESIIEFNAIFNSQISLVYGMKKMIHTCIIRRNNQFEASSPVRLSTSGVFQLGQTLYENKYNYSTNIRKMYGRLEHPSVMENGRKPAPKLVKWPNTSPNRSVNKVVNCVNSTAASNREHKILTFRGFLIINPWIEPSRTNPVPRVSQQWGLYP